MRRLKRMREADGRKAAQDPGDPSSISTPRARLRSLSPAYGVRYGVSRYMSPGAPPPFSPQAMRRPGPPGGTRLELARVDDLSALDPGPSKTSSIMNGPPIAPEKPVSENTSKQKLESLIQHGACLRPAHQPPPCPLVPATTSEPPDTHAIAPCGLRCDAVGAAGVSARRSPFRRSRGLRWRSSSGPSVHRSRRRLTSTSSSSATSMPVSRPPPVT